jgi:hypothetical protein
MCSANKYLQNSRLHGQKILDVIIMLIIFMIRRAIDPFDCKPNDGFFVFSRNDSTIITTIILLFVTGKECSIEAGTQ